MDGNNSYFQERPKIIKQFLVFRNVQQPHFRNNEEQGKGVKIYQICDMIFYFKVSEESENSNTQHQKMHQQPFRYAKIRTKIFLKRPGDRWKKMEEEFLKYIHENDVKCRSAEKRGRKKKNWQ